MPAAGDLERGGRGMRRVARWAAYTLGGLAALALLAAAAVYVQSERVLRRTYDVPLSGFVAPTDSASIAEGRRLATLRGCLGCHGQRLEGRVFFDEPYVARITAANLTRVVRTHSDAELERIIRRGVRKDGTSVFAMPSGTFRELSDEDLGRIIAFLRSQPEVDGPPARFEARPLGRLGLVLEQFEPVAAAIHDARPRLPTGQPGDGATHGRYLALTICAECHGPRLEGSSEDGTPDLRIVGAYPPAAFAHLLRTGMALGERPLGLMRQTALHRLHLLTPTEVADLYAFLRQRAGAPLPATAAGTELEAVAER